MGNQYADCKQREGQREQIKNSQEIKETDREDRECTRERVMKEREGGEAWPVYLSFVLLLSYF